MSTKVYNITQEHSQQIEAFKEYFISAYKKIITEQLQGVLRKNLKKSERFDRFFLSLFKKKKHDNRIFIRNSPTCGWRDWLHNQ